MKRFLFVNLNLVILVGISLGAIKYYDAYREQVLRGNLQRVQVGMGEAEVIDIIGQPTDRMMSDIPGTYWCYDNDTLGRFFRINPARMGHLVLEMSADGRVVKVFNIE